MRMFNNFVNKLKYFGISLTAFGLIFSVGFSSAVVQASATTEVATETESHIEIESSSSKVASLDTQKYNIESVSQELFGDVQINSSEFLYNLDESSDYIYVTFEGDGYAVFLKDTMELMEYSPQGRLSYPNTIARKYYGGPNVYLTKENNCFVNTVSGESVYLSAEEAESFSSEVRNNLAINYNNQAEKVSVQFDYSSVESNVYSSDGNEKGDDQPSIGDYSYITGLPIADGTYIANYQYFLSDPTHGTNSSNVCGAVAAQLLLSYHNYYSDRRIISNEHLNGNSTTDRESNPNYCEDPMSLTNKDALGSRGTLADGSDDDNSYFAYVVKNVPGSATTSKLKNGLKNILKERNSEISGSIDYTIDSTTGGWFLTLFSVGSSGIVKEIDAGRPTIILMQKSLGGLDHFVVAYGYQEYTYPSTGNTYLGYITHFGWGSTRLNVWVNSAWCYSYTSMKINHTHTYVKGGKIGTSNNYEYKCSVCGHRTDAGINMSSTDRYIERTATIPQNGYNYKDYYVTFATAGTKLFQTFGGKDAKLYLYDSEYNQLAYNDDAGYSLNSLFNYTVEANTPYILRVQFYNSSTTGSIKIGITPSSVSPATYEDIWHLGTNVVGCGFTSTLNTTQVICYTPGTSGTYRFTTNSADSIDTYLYFIDPTSTEACLYNDDGAGSLQAKIDVDLIAGRRYLLIVSAFSITTKSGSMGLSIQKLS